MVLDDADRLVEGFLQAVGERLYRPAAFAVDGHRLFGRFDAGHATLLRLPPGEHVKVDQPVGAALHGVLFKQGLVDLVGLDLPVQILRQLLDDGAELLQHLPGQGDAVELLQQKAHPALAGLAVDPHRLPVGGAHIGGIDGQIGHLPAVPVHLGHALLDGVLMGAGEGREHQVPGVGMAFMHRQLVDGLHRAANARHVPEVQLRVHALAEQVHRHGHDVAVAGALAVAEQGALHPLRPGHKGQLRGGDAGAPVVVGVQADDGLVPVREAGGEPLDLVGIDVGGGHLHRGGQVDDHGLRNACPPLLGHRRADIDGEVQLRAGEALRRVLEGDVRIQARKAALDHAGALDGQVDDAVPRHLEHHPALQLGGGVVQVEDHLGRPVQCLHRAFDQLLPRLAEHLHGDALGNALLVNDAADEVEVRLRRRRKAHFDLRKAHLQQQVEHAQLLLHVHRVDQRLVAVPQVNAAPPGRPVKHPARPPAARQLDGLKGTVLVKRHPAGGAAPRMARLQRRLLFNGRNLLAHGRSSPAWLGLGFSVGVGLRPVGG